MGTGEPSRAAAQWARGLTGGQLDAIAALERRVVDHDGARLKLEWGHLRSRAGERPEDLLWCEDGRLLGFLGLYRFGGTTVELAGMVDPDARRRGIGTALLDAALAECRVRGHAQALLIVPRGSVGGAVLAGTRGGSLHHSEHALALQRPPADAPADTGLVVDTAAVVDRPELARVIAGAFGETPEHIHERACAAGLWPTACTASHSRSPSTTTARSACTRRWALNRSRPRTTTSCRCVDRIPRPTGWPAQARRNLLTASGTNTTSSPTSHASVPSAGPSASA